METRTIAEIKQEIAGDYAHLSKVSVLRHLQDVIAVAVWLLQELFAAHKTEVQEIVDAARPGTLAWYRQQALNFQYGHELVLIDYIPGYAEEDEDAKIIAYCDVTENIGGIVMKVAKVDRTEVLTEAEDEAFRAYLSKIKHPGTSVALVNQLADEIVIDVDLVVNHEIINSQGKLQGTNTYPVSDAIDDYFENGEFGGKLYVDHLIDVIQAVEGVISVKLNYLDATSATLVNTVIYDLSIGTNLMYYNSEAGHMVIDNGNSAINIL